MERVGEESWLIDNCDTDRVTAIWSEVFCAWDTNRSSPRLPTSVTERTCLFSRHSTDTCDCVRVLPLLFFLYLFFLKWIISHHRPTRRTTTIHAIESWQRNWECPSTAHEAPKQYWIITYSTNRNNGKSSEMEREHASMLFMMSKQELLREVSFIETAVLLVPWPFGLYRLRSLSLDCPQTY